MGLPTLWSKHGDSGFECEHQLEPRPLILDGPEVGILMVSLRDSWISYDDVRSIESKVQYARDLSLGGYFFWALDTGMGIVPGGARITRDLPPIPNIPHRAL
ncbi:acidic mammalian chitinase-like protein [Tanacetum coccineum]